MVAMNSTLSDFSFLAIGYNAGLDFARYTPRNGLRLRVRPRRDAAKADEERSAVISRHRVEAPASPWRASKAAEERSAVISRHRVEAPASLVGATRVPSSQSSTASAD